MTGPTRSAILELDQLKRRLPELIRHAHATAGHVGQFCECGLAPCWDWRLGARKDVEGILDAARRELHRAAAPGAASR